MDCMPMTRTQTVSAAVPSCFAAPSLLNRSQQLNSTSDDVKESKTHTIVLPVDYLPAVIAVIVVVGAEVAARVEVGGVVP